MLTEEELNRIENNPEKATKNGVWYVDAKDFRALVAEVRRLHGLQHILADCRMESSAWPDGYRTAIRDMLRLIDSYAQSWTAPGPLSAVSVVRGALLTMSPEASLAAQRKEQSC